MDYEFWNFIVNCCVAVGTIGTVVTAIYLSMPKKEKAEGYFAIDFFMDSEKLTTWVNNTGNKNIKFDDKVGAYLKINNDNEHIGLDSFGGFYLPKKKQRSFEFIILLRENNIARKIYENKNCTLSMYTAEGTEIELKKKI